LLAIVSVSEHVIAFTPGLLVIGLGLGVMLTPSVNIVQSSFPEHKQGEISGLSRSVSNLGSSLGTAIAGTILVADLANSNKNLPYILAMASLAVLAVVGLVAAVFLPANAEPPPAPDEDRRLSSGGGELKRHRSPLAAPHYIGARGPCCRIVGPADASALGMSSGPP
jgi:MFS family permease